MTRSRLIVLVALLAVLAGVGGVALLVNILERKQESRHPFYRLVELNDTITDPAVCSTSIVPAKPVTGGRKTS